MASPPEGIVTVEFAPGISVVREDGDILGIDYRNRLVCRKNRDCVACSCQSFAELEPDERLHRQPLFVEVERVAGTGPGEVGLVFGRRAMLMRSVAGVRYWRYGLDFSPARIDFRNIRSEYRTGELSRAVSEAAARMTTQLFSRYDLLGLIPILGGIPGQMKRQDSWINLRFLARPEEELQYELTGCTGR